MSTWVKSINDPDNVDLETVAANHNTIKVNDVQDAQGGGDNKKAIETANSSTAADARSLKATGMSEVIANSADNPASTGLLVKNLSTNDNSIALQVEGPSEDDRTKLVLKHCTI